MTSPTNHPAMSDASREAFEAWARSRNWQEEALAPGPGHYNGALQALYDIFTAGMQAGAQRQQEEVQRLREALRQMMIGCEYKTITFGDQAITGWHAKAMPTDAALDAARAALESKQ